MHRKFRTGRSQQTLVIWEGRLEELGLEMIGLEGEREWERKVKTAEGTACAKEQR